jgi:hypothetical protein
MSVTRGTKITELCCCASEHVSSDPDMVRRLALPLSAVVQAAKVGSARAQQLRQLGDVRGDPPRLVAGEQPLCKWLRC